MISIVMTAYKRAKLLRRTLLSLQKPDHVEVEVVVVEDGYDGGETQQVCEEFGARYFCRRNRPDVNHSNSGVPNNIGIKQAKGDILIIQNAECLHAVPGMINYLAQVPPEEVWFGAATALDQDGNFACWYCHPAESNRPYFFCGSIWRRQLIELGGFDEDFRGYGYEDDDLAARMKVKGLMFRWIYPTEVLVQHQYHETYIDNYTQSIEVFRRNQDRLAAGASPIVNVGREWGVIE